MPKCPNCKSKKIKPLGEYKTQLVMRGKHQSYKKIERYICKKCNEEFWLNEAV
jgi:transposase-like protein